jgi:hypothetical protein
MLTPYVRGGSARELLDVILQGIEQHHGIGRTEQIATVWQFGNAFDVPMNSEPGDAETATVRRLLEGVSNLVQRSDCAQNLVGVIAFHGRVFRPSAIASLALFGLQLQCGRLGDLQRETRIDLQPACPADAAPFSDNRPAGERVTARGFWDTGLNPTPPYRRVEADSARLNTHRS